MDKACPLTSLFQVSSRRLLVDVKTISVSMEKLVGFLLPTTILAYSTVRLVKARLPLLNTYTNGCKYIALISVTSMFLWIKEVSYMVIQIFLMYLPIITIKSILLERILPIKMVWLSALIVSLVTIFVPS